MALGVDTVSALSSINWGAFHEWCGLYPVFAGRYFGGGYNWVAGEFSAAFKATGETLTRIVPIQASESGRQQTAGSTGYSYGTIDADATCQSIVSAINACELKLPATGFVYVYLDTEQGTNLSADYWAGWSNGVFNYAAGSSEPFFPCIYAWYGEQTNGNYTLGAAVQNALNSATGSYPKHDVQCYGLWSNEPEPCSYCNFPKTNPRWSVFDLFSQNLYGFACPVPLLLYQFAEQSGCNTVCNNSTFAGGQNLDLDSDNSGASGAQNYMLVIA